MKIYVYTLAFNRPSIVRKALDHLANTTNRSSYDHILVDCSYPLPDQAENTVALAQMASNFESLFLKPLKNRGIHENYNWMFREVGLVDGDLWAGFDPDNRPRAPGWLEDAVKVMADESVGYCALSLPHAYHVPAVKTYQINGVPVCEYDQPGAWSMGVWSATFLRKCGGMGQLHPQYGYIENVMLERMRAHGVRPVWMTGHVDGMLSPLELADCDKSFETWKRECAHQKTQSDYETWLHEQGIL